MIYIVEIPHRLKPVCWSAIDETEAVTTMLQAHIKMDAKGAIAGLKEIGGHGAVEAIAALREELQATGELPEEASDEA